MRIKALNADCPDWEPKCKIGDTGTIMGLETNDLGCSNDDPSYYVLIDDSDYTDLFFAEELALA